MKAKNIKYSEKTLAFLDILGFERLVNQSKNNPELVSRIANILVRSKTIALSILNAKLTILKVSPQEYTYRAFSDTSIIIGSYSSDDDMSYLSMWVMFFQYLMWKEESTFIRGAIGYGDIYQDQDVVFGPALIDAYHLERDEGKASWPRVLVGESLLNKITDEERARAFYEFLRQDDDNLVYLDYLREMFHLLILGENKSVTGELEQDFGEPIRLFEDHKKAILTQRTNILKEEDQSKRKRIIGKYWELSKYHNAIIASLCRVTKDLVSNPTIIRAVFEDQFNSFISEQSGLEYESKYNAERHPEQTDLLNTLAAVGNVLIKNHPRDNATLEEVTNMLCVKGPEELSKLDIGLHKSMIDINSLI